MWQEKAGLGGNLSGVISNQPLPLGSCPCAYQAVLGQVQRAVGVKYLTSKPENKSHVVCACFYMMSKELRVFNIFND